ncbi:hypothetical protein BOTCAL_0056g00110 [Botryotinia calthae]|uniref:Uncharacterized protein n=1 Tax=Botryotinia calthae TaxID=38488 RepID=A0A4Y8DAC2_9HELO|nr:hypothetical protein BOTCAL_0056g00110 [Botryotinia calthae]
MNQLWSSDEWKATRAYGQVPELLILTAEEMWNSRRLRRPKADASPVPPARRSERIKSMKTRLDVKD